MSPFVKRWPSMPAHKEGGKIDETIDVTQEGANGNIGERGGYRTRPRGGGCGRRHEQGAAAAPQFPCGPPTLAVTGALCAAAAGETRPAAPATGASSNMKDRINESAQRACIGRAKRRMVRIERAPVTCGHQRLLGAGDPWATEIRGSPFRASGRGCGEVVFAVGLGAQIGDSGAR